ncbi:hypothetical protein [Streptomyces thioluteus]|uniref:hypothetical protein n=1 Tax=Streptomyces thioluteus TaxID=66431 RepID=UPI0031E6D025
MLLSGPSRDRHRARPAVRPAEAGREGRGAVALGRTSCARPDHARLFADRVAAPSPPAAANWPGPGELAAYPEAHPGAATGRPRRLPSTVPRRLDAVAAARLR